MSFVTPNGLSLGLLAISGAVAPCDAAHQRAPTPNAAESRSAIRPVRQRTADSLPGLGHRRKQPFVMLPASVSPLILSITSLALQPRLSRHRDDMRAAIPPGIRGRLFVEDYVTDLEAIVKQLNYATSCDWQLDRGRVAGLRWSSSDRRRTRRRGRRAGADHRNRRQFRATVKQDAGDGHQKKERSPDHEGRHASR